MSAIFATRYHPIGMSVSNSIVDAAASPAQDYWTIAAKVACYTVIPFLMIAAFEAIVLNFARSLANAILYIADYVRPLCHHPAERTFACTDRQKKIIHQIVAYLAENTEFTILRNKPMLDRLGAEIQTVHPFKFVSAILLDPTAKAHLQIVFANFFKRNGFMNGVNTSFAMETTRNRVYSHLSLFAAEMRVPAETVRPFIDNRDYVGLVRRFL